MVPFVPDHVLEQQDWMIAVNVHTPACLQPALYRVPHRLRALIQHLSNASRVTLGDPLLVGQLSGELGCILENSATVGLPSIALTSNPPSGIARSRLTRMVLFRSHESSTAPSTL